jgi:NitT/TauT family transport system substrate-binding protein
MVKRPTGFVTARFLASLCLCILVIIIPDAGWARTVRFQFDWMPNGEKSALYYGVEKGVFAAEGIELTFVAGRGTADALAKMGAGAADVGIGDISTLMSAKAEGDFPVSAVMAIYTRKPDALYAVQGGSIRSLADVVGKTIGMPPYSGSSIFWPVMMATNHIDARAVIVKNIDPVALPAMLAMGRADAVVGWTTEAPAFAAVLAAAGKTPLVIPWADFGLDGYGMVVFATDGFMATQPDTLRAFLRAYRTAIRLAEADPAAAAAALHRAVPEVPLDVAEAGWRATLPLIFNDISARDGLGRFDPALLATTWDWVARSEHFRADQFALSKTVDTSFLPAE